MTSRDGGVKDWRGTSVVTITERIAAGITIVDVNGRITVQDGAAQFRAYVRHLLYRGQLNLVINLQAVPYIDSTGLGEIARAHATATQSGGALKFLHLRGRVRDLFGVAKLLTVFEVFDTEDAALGSFQAPSS